MSDNDAEEWWMLTDPEASAELRMQLSPGAVIAPLGTFGERIRPVTDGDRLIVAAWESVGLERVIPDVRGGARRD